MVRMGAMQCAVWIGHQDSDLWQWSELCGTSHYGLYTAHLPGVDSVVALDTLFFQVRSSLVNMEENLVVARESAAGPERAEEDGTVKAPVW